MATLIDTIAVGNTLGEGPVWDDRAGRLWWTDIHARRLYHWDWDTRQPVAHELSRRVGSFCLTDEDGCLLCALASGFALVWPEAGRIEWLHIIEPEYRGIRMNDGRLDRSGRFWAGSMVEQDDVAAGDAGSLYSFGPQGAVTEHFGGIRISNSISFSPDGSRLYFADTPTRRIDCFAIDDGGKLGPQQVFAQVDGSGFPDGSEVDADGFLWNAEWGSGQLTRYGPDGSIAGHVAVPVSRPTCLAFGGPDLDHAFVTSSRLELDDAALSAEPEAGNVLILKTATRGLPAPRFALASLGECRAGPVEGPASSRADRLLSAND